MSIQSYLRAAPKAELHVHLEGSIQPEMLLTLAQRNGAALPTDTVDGLRQWFTFRDFAHFVEIYVAITRCLKTADDYDDVTYAFGAEMARQNVRYAEVTFTPSTQDLLGVPFDVYFAGLTRGRARAERDFGVAIRWIFDIVRDLGDATRRAHYADYTVATAIEGMRDGVVALGLGGAEARSAPEPFAPYFERARAAGLHSIPHAGETAGPASIWGALRALHAERIGHGVRAIEDETLVAYLVENRVPLEVNPTSNLRLGVYSNLAEHPLRRLHDAGVIVTVNSDDPALFNTTLNNEVALLADPFGFDLPAVDAVLLNGVRYSFLPQAHRESLLAEYEAELAALKAEHLSGADD